MAWINFNGFSRRLSGFFSQIINFKSLKRNSEKWGFKTCSSHLYLQWWHYNLAVYKTRWVQFCWLNSLFGNLQKSNLTLCTVINHLNLRVASTLHHRQRLNLILFANQFWGSASTILQHWSVLWTSTENCYEKLIWLQPMVFHCHFNNF